MKKLPELLQNLELSDYEISVYKFLISSGPKKASHISQQIKTTRTNTYAVLEKLIKKGLILKLDKTGVAQFAPSPPEALQVYLQKKRSGLENAQLDLTKQMGGLQSLYQLSQNLPGVHVFRGKQELIESFEVLLREGLDIDIIMDRPRFREFLADYNRHFVKMRIRKGIRTRVITPNYSRISSKDQGELREVRYLDHKQFPFEMDLKITKKHVVLTTLKSDYAIGILISDNEIAKNFSILFNTLWINAERTI